MNRTLVAGLLLAAAGAIGAHPSHAQENFIARRIYFALGAGAGFFTPTCDTGCVGDRLGAGALAAYLGWPVGSRARVEVGAQRAQSTSDTSGATGGYHASAVSVGLSLYATRNLFIRGGIATRLGLGAGDAAGAPIEGTGGPGFTVGAGYDFVFAKRLAFTPYVSLFGGSIRNLEYFSGTSTVPTAGSQVALHGGLFFTYRPWPKR